MTEILFNEQPLLTTVPPLTDRVFIYPQAGFREDADTDLIAEQKAIANTPQPFTLQNLKALLAPPAATNVAGVMEVATGTEVAAGTDSSKALTPATFQQNTRIDATLAGAGTIREPWRVANPFTDADERKLDGIAERAASDFTGLSDTPASLGTAGQILAVNSAADAMEFVDAPSGGGRVRRTSGTVGRTRISISVSGETDLGVRLNDGGIYIFDLGFYSFRSRRVEYATSIVVPFITSSFGNSYVDIPSSLNPGEYVRVTRTTSGNTTARITGSSSTQYIYRIYPVTS